MLLVVYFLNIEITDLKIKSLAAVLLRKLILISEGEITNKNWVELNDDYKETLKVSMLKALVTEKDRSMKMKIGDVVVQVASNVYEHKQKWEDLLTYISNTLITPLNENNMIEAETALFLIKNIFAYTHLDILKGIGVLIPVFRTYFKTNNLSLRTRTVETICEIICIVDKKHTKLLKEFVFNILDTTYQCLQNPKEENNVN